MLEHLPTHHNSFIAYHDDYNPHYSPKQPPVIDDQDDSEPPLSPSLSSSPHNADTLSSSSYSHNQQQHADYRRSFDSASPADIQHNQHYPALQRPSLVSGDSYNSYSTHSTRNRPPPIITTGAASDASHRGYNNSISPISPPLSSDPSLPLPPMTIPNSSHNPSHHYSSSKLPGLYTSSPTSYPSLDRRMSEPSFRSGMSSTLSGSLPNPSPLAGAGGLSGSYPGVGFASGYSPRPSSSYGSLNHHRDSYGPQHSPDFPPPHWNTAEEDYASSEDHFASPSSGPILGGPGVVSPHLLPAGMTSPSLEAKQDPLAARAKASGAHRNSKTYSFVALPGNAVKKRPRRRYDEIERLYQCNYPNCSKAYGTLNHLNAHVTMQKHGSKRSPSEFKELRKQWRQAKKEADDVQRERERHAREYSATMTSGMGSISGLSPSQHPHLVQVGGGMGNMGMMVGPGMNMGMVGPHVDYVPREMHHRLSLSEEQPHHPSLPLQHMRERMSFDEQRALHEQSAAMQDSHQQMQQLISAGGVGSGEVLTSMGMRRRSHVREPPYPDPHSGAHSYGSHSQGVYAPQSHQGSYGLPSPIENVRYGHSQHHAPGGHQQSGSYEDDIYYHRQPQHQQSLPPHDGDSHWPSEARHQQQAQPVISLAATTATSASARSLPAYYPLTAAASWESNVSAGSVGGNSSMTSTLVASNVQGAINEDGEPLLTAHVSLGQNRLPQDSTLLQPLPGYVPDHPDHIERDERWERDV